MRKPSSRSAGNALVWCAAALLGSAATAAPQVLEKCGPDTSGALLVQIDGEGWTAELRVALEAQLAVEAERLNLSACRVAQTPAATVRAMLGERKVTLDVDSREASGLPRRLLRTVPRPDSLNRAFVAAVAFALGDLLREVRSQPRGPAQANNRFVTEPVGPPPPQPDSTRASPEPSKPLPTGERSHRAEEDRAEPAGDGAVGGPTVSPPRFAGADAPPAPGPVTRADAQALGPAWALGARAGFEVLPTRGPMLWGGDLVTRWSPARVLALEAAAAIRVSSPVPVRTGSVQAILAGGSVALLLRPLTFLALELGGRVAALQLSGHPTSSRVEGFSFWRPHASAHVGIEVRVAPSRRAFAVSLRSGAMFGLLGPTALSDNERSLSTTGAGFYVSVGGDGAF